MLVSVHSPWLVPEDFYLLRALVRLYPYQPSPIPLPMGGREMALENRIRELRAVGSTFSFSHRGGLGVASVTMLQVSEGEYSVVRGFGWRPCFTEGTTFLIAKQRFLFKTFYCSCHAGGQHTAIQYSPYVVFASERPWISCLATRCANIS